MCRGVLSPHTNGKWEGKPREVGNMVTNLKHEIQLEIKYEVCHRKIIRNRYSVEGETAGKQSNRTGQRERIPDSKLDETEILWASLEKKLKITLSGHRPLPNRKYTWTRTHFEIVLSLFQCWRVKMKWKAFKKEQQQITIKHLKGLIYIVRGRKKNAHSPRLNTSGENLIVQSL